MVPFPVFAAPRVQARGVLYALRSPMVTFVAAHDPILGKTPPGFLPPAAKAFWTGRGLSACDGAIVWWPEGAKDFGGFLRFWWDADTRELFANGTWINPGCRRAHMAVYLWRKALDYFGPAKVKVCVTSKGGERLVASLKEQYPEIKWRVYRPR